MPKSTSRVARPANWVLATLPAGEYEAVAPGLERVTLEPNTVLYEVGVSASHVYFPCAGFVALMAPLRRDRWVEVATTGRVGVVGLCVFLGSGTAGHRALVQGTGEGFRMTAADFRAVLGRAPTLPGLLLRYADALLTQLSQSAVCNGHHPLRRRLCRWLLEARDRCDSDRLPFTQSLLAEVLTVRPASVSEAVASLRDAGLIATHAGHVTITDRAGLEAAACPCYRLIAGRFNRLVDEYRRLANGDGAPAEKKGRRR